MYDKIHYKKKKKTSDLKLTLKWHSNRGNCTTLEWEEDDIRSRQLSKDAEADLYDHL